MQSASTAKLIPADGILYPYQRSGAIVNCPDGTNLKPAVGGAPFTIDVNDAPLGYDKNVLLVYNLTAADGTAYGPFRNATQWDNVADSILLVDAAYGIGPTSTASSTPSSSFNGVNPPRVLTSGRADTPYVAGRHSDVANVSFQDTHAKSRKVSYTGAGTTNTRNHMGYILGPNAGAPNSVGANYYYVPDKSAGNPNL
ncbi:hypothetical protein EON77_13020 [bacterium]|nr:MAG: hypothetical protein EON77_13020 [bacterium]